MNATSLARVKAALRRFSRAEADELLATVLLLDDAQRIRRELLFAFERAENSVDSEIRRRLMTIVVVAGFVGRSRGPKAAGQPYESQ